MKFYLIKNSKGFENFYPYRSNDGSKQHPTKREYPKRYPCFCRIVDHDGGIGGDYMTVQILYPPKKSGYKSLLLWKKILDELV